jgi:hypothetical protein
MGHRMHLERERRPGMKRLIILIPIVLVKGVNE